MRALRTRAARLAAPVLAAAVGVASWPAPAGAATRLYIRNHVYSNDVRSIVAWNGTLVAATTGGLVTGTMSGGTLTSLTKTLAAPGGLPSNRTLSLVESPSGDLWIGTVDAGIARLTPGGTWRRTLTTFDGLPSSDVQTFLRSGDSVWVGALGGVALFTENPANARVSLRRSDTGASTAGALVSDDVRALAILGDTLWVGTGAGLSAFTAGAWVDRRDVFGGTVNALLAPGSGDTLWIGTAAGPRAYAGGVLAPVEPGHAGPSLALALAGSVLYSGSSTSNVYRRSGGAWTATGSGLPLGSVNTLGFDPGGALWAGAQSGLARYDPGADRWTAYLTQGPQVESLQKVAVRAHEAWFTPGNQTGPGLSAGFVLRTDGAAWSAVTNLGTGGSLQGTSVFGILAARDGALWLGHCCGSGVPRPRVERYDPDAGTWVYPGPGNVWSFAQAPDGRVYGAGVELTNGVYVFDSASGAVLDSLTPENTQGSARGAGLISNNLRDIEFDPAGVGWIGSAELGVDRWDGRGTDAHADDFWDHYGTGLPSTKIRSLTVLDASTVYVGTDAGVAVLVNGFINPARQDAINAAIGAVVVEDLAHDPRGVVWIGTSDGLGRFDHAALVLERFTTADGLVDNDVRGLAWDEGRGILWVATARGVSEVHPQTSGSPGIGPRSYVYPNPAGAGGSVRIGGLTGAVTGEIRDVAGNRVRNFRADPVANSIWDLKDASGAPASPGVYLVLIRDGDRVETMRIAVTR